MTVFPRPARRPAPAPGVPVPAVFWAAWVQSGLDALRHQHAIAVQAGLAPRSALGAARFEAWLGQVERLALGGLARRV